MNGKNNSLMLFLIELIFSILIFSFCAAIAVNIFTKSYNISKKSNIRTCIAMESENIIQCIKHSKNTLNKAYDVDKINDDTYIYFDENINPCNIEKAVYTAIISCENQQNIDVFTIEFFENNKSIYSIKTAVESEGVLYE